MCDLFAASAQSFNELQLVVVSSDPNNTYIVDITRSLIVSNNANLISLQWRSDSGAVVDQSAIVSSSVPANFSSRVFDYALTLCSGLSTLRFAASMDALATLWYTTTRVQIGPPAVDLAPSSAPQSLSSGQLSAVLSVGFQQRLRVQTLVLAEDQLTNKSYTFTLTRFEDAALGAGGSSSSSSSSGGGGGDGNGNTSSSTSSSTGAGAGGSSMTSSSGSAGSAQSTGGSGSAAHSRFSSSITRQCTRARVTKRGDRERAR